MLVASNRTSYVGWPQYRAHVSGGSANSDKNLFEQQDKLVLATNKAPAEQDTPEDLSEEILHSPHPAPKRRLPRRFFLFLSTFKYPTQQSINDCQDNTK